MIDGASIDGFEVLNPLYCYEGGRVSFKNMFNKQDPISIERAAIILNRGWIPADLRDKRSRPNEINSRQLVRFKGVWRKGKGLHEYKHPNSPNDNEWNNVALEDIGLYWDLPNFDEIKHYYFQAVDLKQGEDIHEYDPLPFPQPLSKDELIEEHYKWRSNENTNKAIYRSLGAASLVSLGFALFA